MKKLILLALILVIFQKWEAINQFFNPPPDYAAIHNGKVILYATSWCGYCAKTRKLLRENKIDYYEYDIEKSVIGREQHASLGGRGIPVLLINGEVVKGYNPAKILKLINKP
jgi:glutaredoxin